LADPQAQAIEKLIHALTLATRELATIVTMDEDAPQAAVAGGAVVRAKGELSEVAALLGVKE
jgi:hypothetical protein